LMECDIAPCSERCAEATLFFGAGLVMLWRDERSNR